MCKAITKKGAVCKNKGDPCYVHVRLPMMKAPVHLAPIVMTPEVVVVAPDVKIQEVVVDPIFEKEKAVKIQLGIHLQEMDTVGFRFDGPKLYITGNKKLFSSLVGKTSSKNTPTDSLFEFDLRTQGKIVVTWWATKSMKSMTLTVVPEKWKAICKTLAELV